MKKDPRMIIKVHKEFVDEKFVAYVSHYAPLDLYSQGNTYKEAIKAMRSTIVSHVKLSVPHMITHRGPDLMYRTGEEYDFD